MIITTSSLNSLENLFSPHSLGIEVINGESLTYNSVLSAINNNYLPVIKFVDEWDVTQFGAVYAYGLSNGYYVEAGSYTIFQANSVTSIMNAAGTDDACTLIDKTTEIRRVPYVWRAGEVITTTKWNKLNDIVPFAKHVDWYDDANDIYNISYDEGIYLLNNLCNLWRVEQSSNNEYFIALASPWDSYQSANGKLQIAPFH